MARKCSFPGCQSGSTKERRINKSKNIPNTRLYAFPKQVSGSEIREKWVKAIGRPVEDNVFICELHFLPKEILKYESIPMPNGETCLIERAYACLHHAAVPKTIGEISSILLEEKNKGNNQVLIIEQESMRTRLPLQPVENTVNHQASPMINKNQQFTNQSTQNKQIQISSNVLNEENQVDFPSRQEQITTSLPLQSLKKRINNQSLPIFDKRQRSSDRIVPVASPFLDLLDLYDSMLSVNLPKNWATLILDDKVVIGCWLSPIPTPAKQLFIFNDFSIKIYMGQRLIKPPPGILQMVQSLDDIEHNVKIIDTLFPCDGPGEDKVRPKTCANFIDDNKKNIRYAHRRCRVCRKERIKNKLKERKNKKLHEKLEAKLKKTSQKLKLSTAKVKRMKKKVLSIKKQMSDLKKVCASKDHEAIEKKIAELPESQQESVRACFAAAKTPSNGRRYTQQWIYECILMRIKNRSLYEHLRTHGILVLPHIDTLNRYIKRMGSAYGFNNTIFELLSMKSKTMDVNARRGTLLADEIQLSKSIKVDRKHCRFDGFTNLGKYTPEDEAQELGDHALVLMFQPFQGAWVQTIACFLSKSCVKSAQLQPIILECILLLERSGFFVDAVVTDGASWNRTMWTKFGVNKDNISCQHPCNPERKLWFCSDFPHLIKTFRNKLISVEEIRTPDGVVKLRHWRAIIEVENDLMGPYSLKMCYKLTEDHLNPQYYQKMNVPMAFQLFDDRVEIAMELYKKYHAHLHDAEPSRKLCKRVRTLINAMMSRTPMNALRPGSDEEQAIKDFLQFIKEWRMECEENGWIFLTEQTAFGFEVTLQATLEILEFLTKENNFKYIMTSRLNQDALERFFSLARGACGSNDHPDSILFGQMFLLLGTYALIKPVKGSNIAGGEMLNTLLQVTDINHNSTDKEEWYSVIDSLFEKQSANTINSDHQLNGLCQPTTNHEHRREIFDLTTTYMSGYVAYKSPKWTKCNDCIGTLKTERLKLKLEDRMISLLSKGYLSYPTESLVELITVLEQVILETVNNSSLNADTLFQITYSLQEHTLPLVGCEEHAETLSKIIVRFYLMMRAEFIAKNYNKNNFYQLKQNTRKSRKDSKLNTETKK